MSAVGFECSPSSVRHGSIFALIEASVDGCLSQLEFSKLPFWIRPTLAILHCAHLGHPAEPGERRIQQARLVTEIFPPREIHSFVSEVPEPK